MKVRFCDKDNQSRLSFNMTWPTAILQQYCWGDSRNEAQLNKSTLSDIRRSKSLDNGRPKHNVKYASDCAQQFSLCALPKKKRKKQETNPSRSCK